MDDKMPPRKDRIEEALEELKESLGFQSEELKKLTRQQETLDQLVLEVKSLKKTINERDNKIEELEKRLDEVEQYTRMEDVIISGLKVKPRTYARAAAPNPEGNDEEQPSVEKQVIDFLKSKEIVVDPSGIAACHTLPSKDRKANPVIIMRFANRRNKELLLKEGKKLKGTDVYINEHLTKKNADIAREARSLKKNKKIQGTWTRSCKVLIKLNGETAEEAKIIVVRDAKELDKYK